MRTAAARIATLRSYGVLDTPAEPAFDRIAQAAAAAFRVRSALVSFIDETRQWYKARVGVDASEVPRALSFCTHSIERAGVTVIGDAGVDLRFALNPFVLAAAGIRFYAAAPIRPADGPPIGTVCIFDPAPRADFTGDERLRLAGFAAAVMDILEARRS
jgi:GAF domain-containing protein